MNTLDARRALGAFLRTHRERMPHQTAGAIPQPRRRRTPGLRREELAASCGVSLTWITWLEQGRDVSPSPRALARLADALRLASAERAYLFELAGKRDPDPLPNEEDLPAPVLALPGRMIIPAYLLDGSWTARSWNHGAASLFAGWLDGDHDRNLMRFIFRSPAAPRLIADWDERARRVAAEFRADFSRNLRDPAMQGLVEELSQIPVFRSLWEEQAVLAREGGERRFNNPSRRFHQSSFILSAPPNIKLVTLTPLDV
jgi:transcriptional regulator with XRE-family HTH domain